MDGKKTGSTSCIAGLQLLNYILANERTFHFFFTYYSQLRFFLLFITSQLRLVILYCRTLCCFSYVFLFVLFSCVHIGIVCACLIFDIIFLSFQMISASLTISLFYLNQIPLLSIRDMSRMSKGCCSSGLNQLVLL